MKPLLHKDYKSTRPEGFEPPTLRSEDCTKLGFVAHLWCNRATGYRFKRLDRLLSFCHIKALAVADYWVMNALGSVDDSGADRQLMQFLGREPERA